MPLTSLSQQLFSCAVPYHRGLEGVGACGRMGTAVVAEGKRQSFSHVLLGESIKAAGKGRSNHRARNKRGSRARASKDTSKLLLLYDENILERDPLREQKDLAFAQAYLTRVGKCCFLLLLFHLNEATSPIREVFLK